MKEEVAQEVFIELKPILEKYAEGMDCTADEEGVYYLNTHFIMKNKQPLFFGSVQIKKNYVSFHLMPVYENPSLLDNISPELKKRMQGKSCFNFKKVDEELFQQLAALSEKGYQSYQERGYI